MRHAATGDNDPFGPVPGGHEVAQVVGCHLLEALNGAEQRVAQCVALVCGRMQKLGQDHLGLAPNFLDFVGCCFPLYVELFRAEEGVEDGVGKN